MDMQVSLKVEYVPMSPTQVIAWRASLLLLLQILKDGENGADKSDCDVHGLQVETGEQLHSGDPGDCDAKGYRVPVNADVPVRRVQSGCEWEPSQRAAYVCNASQHGQWW